MEAGDDIDDTSGDRSDVVDGYEQLRARALGGDADGWRLGLGVLQQRGVRRLAAGAPGAHRDPPPPTPARSAPPDGGGVDAELVGLLASMALAVAAQG